MLSQLYNKVAGIQTLQTETVSHYAAVLISGVAVVALVIQLRSVYRTASYEPDIAVASNARTVSAGHKEEYQASHITDKNLFGIAQNQQLDKLNLPTTALALQLRGAFTSSNKQLASAIIEGPDGQARSFRVGGRVYGNTILHTVYNDRVVLSRNGDLETLYFPDPSQTADAPSPGAATGIANAIPEDLKTLVQENMSLEEMQQTGRQLRSPSMTDEQRKELIRKRLLQIRDRARQKK